MDGPNSGKSQVQVKLQAACGCGYLAATLKDALKHAEGGHVMTVNGQIGLPERLSGARVLEVKRD